MGDTQKSIGSFLIPQDDSVNDNLIIPCILKVFLLSELAEKQAFNCPWESDERLGKRRIAYAYDWHLQNMLLYANDKNNVKAYCIECGNSNYYRTELLLNDQYYIHFNQSFNPNSNYIKRYLNLNKTPDSEQFAYFIYSFDKDLHTVNLLQFIVPCDNGKSRVRLDLTDLLEQFRNVIPCSVNITDELSKLQWEPFRLETKETTTNGNI